MKAVILAGGYGTRISEETDNKPKPMVEIGEKPLIWHIMKLYSNYGINDFVICLGYKGYVIKEFFANYFLQSSDITIDVKKNKITVNEINTEPWTITLVDTGIDTMTGGRIKKVRKYLDETFCLTYGDGVSNVDISKLIAFHKKNKSLVTVTTVKHPGRFGSLSLQGNKVKKFVEKPAGDSGWINGGFFVIEPEALDYIKNNNTIFENEPLINLAKDRKLSAFRHTGFWHSVDTLRDKKYLDELWAKGNTPWKVW
jgi:glucose-1-phosphate cytidylyltransferase